MYEERHGARVDGGTLSPTRSTYANNRARGPAYCGHGRCGTLINRRADEFAEAQTTESDRGQSVAQLSDGYHDPRFWDESKAYKAVERGGT